MSTAMEQLEIAVEKALDAFDAYVDAPNRDLPIMEMSVLRSALSATQGQER